MARNWIVDMAEIKKNKNVKRKIYVYETNMLEYKFVCSLCGQFNTKTFYGTPRWGLKCGYCGEKFEDKEIIIIKR